MLLPGVLRAEQADLITVDLVNRAMGILVNAFRYIVFDLGVAFTDIVISVLDHSQRVLVLVTPELSSLKDVGELLNIFTNVLNIVPGRVILALNNKVPRSVVSKEDVVRTLKQELAVEIDFDGTKPDEAAVRGEILVLTDPKSAISRGSEQLAQLIVDITNRRVVRTACVHDHVVGHLERQSAAHLADAAAVRVQPVVANRTHDRHVDGDTVVSVPVLGQNFPRIVRLAEGRDHEEWLLVACASQVVNCSHGPKRHLFVVVDLKGCFHHPGLENAAHVVVPLEAIGQRGLPIGDPVHASGVDVRRQPLFEAVQLVWADEVHLAGKAGAVAGCPHAMGNRRHGGGELRAVVIDPDS